MRPGAGARRIAPGGGTGNPLRSGEELFAATHEGCVETFGELYGRKIAVVRGFLAKRVADRDLSWDLAQETFVRALKAVDAFTSGSADAWLCRIARNLVVDHVRRAITRYEWTVADVREASNFDWEDPERLALEAEHVTGQRELARAVLSALTQSRSASA